jgi:formylglycine-generating enzyme required for sulfatase activity
MHTSDTNGRALRPGAKLAISSACLLLVVSLVSSSLSGSAEAKEESREVVTEAPSTARALTSVEARPADDRGPRVDAFELDRTEVTVADYGTCVRAGKCTPPDAYLAAPYEPRALCNWQHPEGRPGHPVNCVDAFQAAAFCAWKKMRLPTEAEWRHAASRAGAFPWGDEAPGPSRLNACGPECGTANSRGLVGAKRVPWASDGFAETAPVGSFPGGDTPDDISDLAGNVWEWTAPNRPLAETADASVDPASERRGLRGGSFYTVSAASFSSDARSEVPATQRSFAVGFRCAR